MNELHLFAGAGGGILGGMLCGHTTVCAVEIEPYCRKVLLQRQRDGILPKFPIWDDVCTFDGTPWRGKVDIVCGGFPCQDISCAGKGAGIEGERSSMWKHMARIIGEIRPEYAFVENSPMLVGRGLSTVLSDLAEMGYDAKWGIMGAHHVSAPHKRDRIWIMAYPMHQRDQRWEQQQESGKETRNVAYPKKLQRNGGNDYPRVSMAGEQIPESGNSSGAQDVAYPSSQRGCSRNTQWKYAEDARESSRHKGNNARRVGWWDSEPNVGRVAHGVASKVDRLKAIGNGQVCAVAELAWKILSK